MRARVHVSLKPGVLDPQGKAVGDALGRLGFSEVGQVRVSKTIDLELADTLTAAEAEAPPARSASSASASTSLPVPIWKLNAPSTTWPSTLVIRQTTTYTP